MIFKIQIANNENLLFIEIYTYNGFQGELCQKMRCIIFLIQKSLKIIVLAGFYFLGFSSETNPEKV